QQPVPPGLPINAYNPGWYNQLAEWDQEDLRIAQDFIGGYNASQLSPPIIFGNRDWKAFAVVAYIYEFVLGQGNEGCWYPLVLNENQIYVRL
ncbi:hypothetical protein PHLCEN_2v2462, partial [Hermanssonia centrifuga]